MHSYCWVDANVLQVKLNICDYFRTRITIFHGISVTTGNDVEEGKRVAIFILRF